MNIHLWVDDIRKMPTDYTHWAKNAEEAIAFLETGRVVTCSLDHDLGIGLTGYDVAKWIEERAVRGTLSPIRCYVHSMNPVGVANISQAIRNAEKAWQ